VQAAIAAVERGALIVEPNFTPDVFMTQLADRCGMLHARCNAFLAARMRDPPPSVAEFTR